MANFRINHTASVQLYGSLLSLSREPLQLTTDDNHICVPHGGITYYLLARTLTGGNVVSGM